MGEHIRVSVAALSGNRVADIELAPWETIAAVKRRVAQATGISASQLSFASGGGVLADSTCLKDCSLDANGELLLCMVRCKQGLTALFGSEDGALRSFNPSAASTSPPARGHASAMRCLDVDRASNSALSGGADGTLHLWECGRRLRSLTAWGLQGHSREVRCLAVDWASERAVSGGADGLLIFWDLKRGTAIRKVKCGSCAVCCVSAGGPSGWVVSGCGDGVLLAHSWTNYELVWQADDRAHGARCMVMDPSSGHVLTGGEDSSLKVWDPARRREALRALRGGCGTVRGLAADWAAQCALSGGDDGGFWLWSLGEGEAVRSLCVHAAPVKCLAVDWASRCVASGCSDGILRLWDLETGEAISEAQCPGGGAVFCVALG